MNEEEIYDKCMAKVKAKLKEIIDPVCKEGASKSYDTLADVITNVILFEINIGKKPFEEIPKKEIALKTKEEVWAEFLKGVYLYGNPLKMTIDKLLEIISEFCSYQDQRADSFTEEQLANFQLLTALKNYQKYCK